MITYIRRVVRAVDQFTLTTLNAPIWDPETRSYRHH